MRRLGQHPQYRALGKRSRYHRGHLAQCDDLELVAAGQGRRRDPRIRQIAGVALKRWRRWSFFSAATAWFVPPCDKSARFGAQAIRYRRHSRVRDLINRRNVHLLGDRSPVIIGVMNALRQRDLLMMDVFIVNLAQSMRDAVQARLLLVVGVDDPPRRLGDISALQDDLFGFGVLLPARPRLDVHGTELPLLEWIVDAHEEAKLLLLVAD